MNILRLLFENLRHGTVSFSLPHKHECTSSEYRGLIHNDETRCVGCGSCAYVCPTGAIEVTRGGDTYRWTYDPGKCTFCARCIDRCRPKTLTQESKLPPLYNTEGGLKQILDMVKKKPVRPPVVKAAAGAETTLPTANAIGTKEPVVPAPPVTNPEPAV